MSTSTSVAWLKRDVLLFAYSIGCKADELHFLYELHPHFQVFPTYPVILSFKDSTQEVIPYDTTLPHPPIPHLTPQPPPLDPSRVVDGVRHLKIYKRLPVTTDGSNFSMRKSIVGIYDKGSGTVVHSRHELIDNNSEECFAEVEAQSFYVGQGGWGGPRGPKAINHGDQVYNREPDHIMYEQTNKETSLLYRLNGDYNPLHATPEPGKAMGFPGVILHGLVAWNMCAHAVVRCVGKSDGNSLREFEARFVAPVLPGDQLKIEMWVNELYGNQEVIEVQFLCHIIGKGIALKAGRALINISKRPANAHLEVKKNSKL
ncbi:HotDog domain-containing protein [Amylocarpus encephaloides]|uniref:HotDog domain-containing protein n=1 Tax=Amylocarpus encephaloides TaxID=45428 RepID=A0A9P8C4P8_9HELO|nr:HotDog domain-containing protein [Amylocarpus encephaloides]